MDLSYLDKFPLKNSDHIIKDVDIPVTFVKEHFQLKDHFMAWSFEVLRKTEKDFRKGVDTKDED